MARIRTIKPEFWQDEQIGEMPFGARLLYIGLWNIADDEGLFNPNPAFLKAQIFPYDAITPSEVESFLGMFVERSMIFIYKDQKAQNHGWVVSFRKHQRIDKPQKSKRPAPSLQNPAIRAAYLRRDDFVCAICGGEIPMSTDANKLRASLDHIKPRTKGGHDYPSNIQSVHFGCNASKGNKFVEDSENVPGMVDDGKGMEGNGKEQGKDSCPEPVKTDSSPAAITITLNDGSEHAITETQVHDFAGLYPGIDVMQELRKIRGWCVNNPTKRKTKRGAASFVNNWLSRAQDECTKNPRGPTNGNANGSGNRRESTTERVIRHSLESIEREKAAGRHSEDLG